MVLTTTLNRRSGSTIRSLPIGSRCSSIGLLRLHDLQLVDSGNYSFPGTPHDSVDGGMSLKRDMILQLATLPEKKKNALFEHFFDPPFWQGPLRTELEFGAECGQAVTSRVAVWRQFRKGLGTPTPCRLHDSVRLTEHSRPASALNHVAGQRVRGEAPSDPLRGRDTGRIWMELGGFIGTPLAPAIVREMSVSWHRYQDPVWEEPFVKRCFSDSA